MATIVTIAGGDQITNSRSDLNTNFSNLNSDKLETSVLDTDTSLAANSDSKVATQKAVKAYVDSGGGAVNATATVRGIAFLPTALTIIPRYAKVYAENSNNVLYSSMTLATNTTLSVGLVELYADITVNKISFYAASVAVTGTMKVAVFSEDGATKMFEVTTASISGAGVVTTAVSAVSLKSGNYYVAILPVGTASVNPVVYVGDNNLLDSVSGEPVMEGKITVTASTMPSSITPSSITAEGLRTLYFRLDN